MAGTIIKCPVCGEDKDLDVIKQGDQAGGLYGIKIVCPSCRYEITGV